ncbi:hypothetical protein ACVWWG_001916 [Bradyrhizobium sp. LB7.2]
MSQSPAGHCAAIRTTRLDYWRCRAGYPASKECAKPLYANAEIVKLGSLAETTQHSFDVMRVDFPSSLLKNPLAREGT